MEATASVTAAMEATASVTAATSVTAASGRYGWRNQANCRYCEQGDDRFTQHLLCPRWKEVASKY
jgi:hypothetical protein